MTSKKTVSQTEIKSFHIYLMGQPQPQQLRATGFQIKNGKIIFSGVVDTKATWTFFLHGVAAIKEQKPGVGVGGLS